MPKKVVFGQCFSKMRMKQKKFSEYVHYSILGELEKSIDRP